MELKWPTMGLNWPKIKMKLTEWDLMDENGIKWTINGIKWTKN